MKYLYVVVGVICNVLLTGRGIYHQLFPQEEYYTTHSTGTLCNDPAVGPREVVGADDGRVIA